MKIDKVTIKRFKRFEEETFALEDCLVVVGPNNSGKTTLLQAIATWRLALTRWRELDDYRRHGGAYIKAPITRHAFYPVPLRFFDMLWRKRDRRDVIEIAATIDGRDMAIEIIHDTTEQAYVRPTKNVDAAWLKDKDNVPDAVFIPAMTGLGVEEPLYRQPKIDQLIGQGKPGDILRNLLDQAYQHGKAWNRITDAMRQVFGCELTPPNTAGPSIIAEYKISADDNENYDLASAGSGFLQILMLLTFLNMRQDAILLMDNPDAHLHAMWQDRIYNELRRAALNSNSQLIMTTHSDIVINAAEPKRRLALRGDEGVLNNPRSNQPRIAHQPKMTG